MKHTIFFHIVIRRFPLPALAGMIMVLGACRPAAKGGLPVCPGVDSGQAEIIRYGATIADWGVIVDTLSPTLEWSFTDPTCNPEYFVLKLDTNWTSVYTEAHPLLIETRIPGDERSWVPPDPLSEGTMYIWQIWPMVGEVPFGADTAVFRTGPECVVISPGTMSAPILLFPPDRSVVSSRRPLLEWGDPTECIPPGDYKVQVSETPSFDPPLYERSYYLPHMADLLLPSDGDCTRYYWRVKIDLRDRVDSEDGPWSVTWSFRTNFSGTCPIDPIRVITPVPPFDFPLPGGLPGGGTSPEPSSWIDGHVWHDLCAVPYESTDVAPPGCIWANDIDGYKANGIYESGEPGLEGVTVDLGSGPCPSTGLATALTDGNGRYSFGPLAAGTYCVSINPLSEANITVLIPGTFTFPVLFAEVAEYEITLGDADIHREKNFGWDFQFLPSPSGGAPTAKLLQNAYCRRGPSVDYESMTTLMKGLEMPIDGRNAESSWWWVRIPNSFNHCWLGKSNVQTSGDTSKVPIVEAEPLGCWVRQPQGPDKCVAPCPQGAQPGGACEP